MAENERMEDGDGDVIGTGIGDDEGSSDVERRERGVVVLLSREEDGEEKRVSCDGMLLVNAVVARSRREDWRRRVVL